MCRVGQACNAEEAAEERALFEKCASGNADMEYSSHRFVTVTAVYLRRLEDRVAALEAAVASRPAVANGNGHTGPVTILSAEALHG